MLRFVELKTGHSGNGPAWIAMVSVSRSGRTVYFRGKALKRATGGLISGNHYDLETGEEYWVSGVKKDGKDRHRAGSGKVSIEARAVDEYLRLTGRRSLDATKFEIAAEEHPTASVEFHVVENQRLP